MKTYATAILIASSILLTSCGGSSGDGDGVVEPERPFDGPVSFRVVSSDAVRAKNTEEWVEYMELQFNAALEPLNQINALLPSTMTVNYDECGFINAFYQPSTQSITICDEFVDTVLSIWSAQQPDDAINFTARSINHVLYHEIGHALVDVLNVPSPGNSESVADGIAAVIAGETGRSFDAVISSVVLASEGASFGDVHINGVDRQGDIICWAAGSDSRILFNSSLIGFITDFIENGRDCVAAYQEQRDSIVSLVPKFSQLMESDITDPDIIAIGNPSPEKLRGGGDNTQLASALRNGERDLWVCSASDRNADVLYVFRESTGAYKSTEEGSDTLQFDFRATSNSAVRLDYRSISFVEIIDQISFTNSDQFSGSSNSDGQLACRRAVNAAATGIAVTTL